MNVRVLPHRLLGESRDGSRSPLPRVTRVKVLPRTVCEGVPQCCKPSAQQKGFATCERKSIGRRRQGYVRFQQQ